MNNEILAILPLDLQVLLKNIHDENINEIRLRINEPVILKDVSNDWFVAYNGNLIEASIQNINKSFIIDKRIISIILEKVTSYSLYAYEDEINQGYITIKGGHRIGIAGKAIYQNEKFSTINPIQSINIRISKQIENCSKDAVKHLFIDSEFCNTLIISPPGYGKTTLIRDLIKKLSNGDNNRGFTVGVVDERCEIAGDLIHPYYDIGIRTDIISNTPKNEGMVRLLRSMAPEIIAVDEIATIEDINAILQIVYSGVKVIATIHAHTINEVHNNSIMTSLFNKTNFERFIVCDKYDNNFGFTVYNSDNEVLYRC